jgi:hypothetical protein
MKISYLLTNLIFFATWMSQTMFDVPETDTACNLFVLDGPKKSHSIITHNYYFEDYSEDQKLTIKIVAK